MKLPRLTIKRLMILTAAVALAIGIPLEVNRLTMLRARYLGMLAENERWETIYRRTTRDWREELIKRQAAGEPDDRIAEARRTISGSASMTDLLAQRVALSRRLASHPWETPPPDDKKQEQDPVLMFQAAGLEFSDELLVRLWWVMVPLGGLALFAGRKRLFPANFVS